MSKKPLYSKIAILLILLLAILCAGSLWWIWTHTQGLDSHLSQQNSLAENPLIADIYQDGVLLQSISLSNITEAYTFTVTSTNNGTNEIEVRPGSIGILSASCPDKLCVHQGFIDNSLLPITCLPNRLVIQLRADNAESSDNKERPDISTSEDITPDIITY